MKHTIHGFSQEVALKLNLSIEDLLLLRYLVDFSASPKMKKIKVEDDIYYWVHYPTVCQELPILATKEDTIYRKFNNLIESKVLKRETKKKKVNGKVQTFAFYAFDYEYSNLISNTKYQKNDYFEGIDFQLGKKSELTIFNSEKNPSYAKINISLQTEGLNAKNEKVTRKKCGVDLSIINPSIKKSSSTKLTDDELSFSDLFTEKTKASISKKQIKLMIAKYGTAKLRSELDDFLDKTKHQDLKNITGAFISYLKGDFTPAIKQDNKLSNKDNFTERKYDSNDFEVYYKKYDE